MTSLLFLTLTQGFPYWGDGGSPLPPTSQKFAHSPQQEKFPHSRPPSSPTKFLSPYKKSIPPPLNNNFQVSRPNKNSYFSCSHSSCSIFVLIPDSLDTQVMLILIVIDVHNSQKAVFSFEKGLNCQNHSFSGSLQPVTPPPH